MSSHASLFAWDSKRDESKAQCCGANHLCVEALASEVVDPLSLRERFIWWGALNLGLVLTPILFNAFSSAGVGWRQAIEHGELILVSVALAGLAIVTSIASTPTRTNLRDLRAAVIGFGLVFVLASGLLYADGFRQVADHHRFASETQSYCLLVLAVVLGVLGVCLSYWTDTESAQ